MKTLLLCLAWAVTVPTLVAADVQGFAAGLFPDAGQPVNRTKIPE